MTIPRRLIQLCVGIVIAHCSIGFATPAAAQTTGQLAAGTYRIEGQCSRTFYLGASSAPECGHFVGIRVEVSERPMFIFPLANGGRAWFFVASRQTSRGEDRSTYWVEKVYDQALNAEFSYPAGECEFSAGPTVRCAVWKDSDKSVLARELVFSGSGNWMRDH